MNKGETEHTHAIAFKALHDSMYIDAPAERLEILKANVNNLELVVAPGWLK